MTGGFQWNEVGGDSYTIWIQSGVHLLHILNQPLVNSPGTDFTYNSAAVHLLGVLLQEAVEMPLSKFADQYLFYKLGIQRSRWEKLSQGYVNGGAGIDLRPRDLARLGQFYLQGGSSGGTQILPLNWVSEATRPHFEWRSSFGPLKRFTYGYLWWVKRDKHSRRFLPGVMGVSIFTLFRL